MHKPDHVIDIFLQPGELYFGDRDNRLRTVLGSCVSLTFWHPDLLVGGMCHYMLPSRSHEKRAASELKLDGRYADEALDLMNQDIKATGAPASEFIVKVFGGGNMFPDRSNPVSHVGLKNVEVARKLVIRHGYNCVAEHLGGDGHRNIIFEIWSGHVWVKHAAIGRQDPASSKINNPLQQRNINTPQQDRRMQCAAFA